LNVYNICSFNSYNLINYALLRIANRNDIAGRFLRLDFENTGKRILIIISDEPLTNPRGAIQDLE